MSYSPVRGSAPAWVWQAGGFTRRVVLFVPHPHACCPDGLDEGEGWNVTVGVTPCGAAEQWQIEAGRTRLTDGQAWTLGLGKRVTGSLIRLGKHELATKRTWSYMFMVFLLNDYRFWRYQPKSCFRRTGERHSVVLVSSRIFRILPPSLVEAGKRGVAGATTSTFWN